MTRHKVLHSVKPIVWGSLAMGLLFPPAGMNQTRGASGIQPAVVEARRVFAEAENPFRLKRDKAGNFYVLSRGSSISTYDARKKLLRVIGSQGTGPGEFRSPQDMAVDAAGLIYVADWFNNRVQIVGPGGKQVAQFEFRRPRTIVLLGDGTIAVAGEPQDHLFDLYAGNGQHIRPCGTAVSTGAKSPALNAALNVGRLYADAQDAVLFLFQGLLKPVVRKYTRDCKLATELPVDGTGMSDLVARAQETMSQNMESGQLGLAYTLNALAIDAATGDLWIAAGNHQIFVYSAAGKKLREFKVVDAETKSWMSVQDLMIAGTDLYVAGHKGCFVLEMPKVRGGGKP